MLYKRCETPACHNLAPVWEPYCTTCKEVTVRYCAYDKCGKPLVKRDNECLANFKVRITCGNDCAKKHRFGDGPRQREYKKCTRKLPEKRVDAPRKPRPILMTNDEQTAINKAVGKALTERMAQPLTQEMARRMGVCW